MGLVRNKTVKKSARLLVEKYYSKLGTDFQENKKIVAEVARIPSTRLRNKIAGYTTELMKRISRGSKVKNISLKLQEEEREKRLDFVPEVSYTDAEVQKGIQVDEETYDMLKNMFPAVPSHIRKPQAGH